MRVPSKIRLSGLLFLAVASFAPAAPSAEDIFAATKVKGGVVVHIGVVDGRLTAGLRPTDSYLVQGVDVDAAAVQKVRESLRSKGLYGEVAVDQFDGETLPFIENFANLVVAEDLGSVAMDEVMRVLVPEGVAYVRTSGEWVKTVKPRPAEIDDWTHYFHGPSGNAVAQDSVVAPPERMQWVGSPRWSRHHDRMASMSALVSGGGRMFYIMDEGSRVSIRLPSHWKLIARDAFNGAVLWKREIPKWHNQLWPLKSGPSQLARRLVVDNPLFPALRSGPTAGSGASPKSKILGAKIILPISFGQQSSVWMRSWLCTFKIGGKIHIELFHYLATVGFAIQQTILPLSSCALFMRNGIKARFNSKTKKFPPWGKSLQAYQLAFTITKYTSTTLENLASTKLRALQYTNQRGRTGN